MLRSDLTPTYIYVQVWYHAVPCFILNMSNKRNVARLTPVSGLKATHPETK